MSKKKFGLDRGLDVLMPDFEGLDEAGVRQIPIGDIDPNTNQPRRTFDEEALTALSQSIRDQGVLQPLLVVPVDGGRYRIVAGERRWRASRMAGLDQVPCIVREDLDILGEMEIALIENLQREDLNPIEEAAGVKALMQQCGYTQEKAADRVGRSRSAVANLLRLLTLPDALQKLVRDGMLSAGHARVLAGLSDAAEQEKLAELTMKNSWSVRQLEEAAALLRQQAEKTPVHEAAEKRRPVEFNELEEKLRETFGMKAALSGSLRKGRITLSYTSREELEHIYELLQRFGEL